jgi:hypothetical protein
LTAFEVCFSAAFLLMVHLAAEYTNNDLILPTTADKPLTTSSFLNRAMLRQAQHKLLNPSAHNTLSRLASSSC